MAKKSLSARMRKEMPQMVPITADEATYLSGVRTYRQNCATCHGLPMQPAPTIAKNMFPPAPQLLQTNEMVADDPPGMTFWKVKNGIRLTGMPSFSPALTDQQIWQVSLLLANANKLPPSVQQALVASPHSLVRLNKRRYYGGKIDTGHLRINCSPSPRRALRGTYFPVGMLKVSRQDAKAPRLAEQNNLHSFARSATLRLRVNGFVPGLSKASLYHPST